MLLGIYAVFYSSCKLTTKYSKSSFKTHAHSSVNDSMLVSGSVKNNKPCEMYII